MIITLVKANFSQNNIGTLDSYSVRTSGSNFTFNGDFSIKKDELPDTYTGTITSNTNYVLTSVVVKIGETQFSSNTYTVESATTTHTISIPKASLTGNIWITVGTYKTGSGNGGEEDDGTTNYTFTISPTPSTATVTLTASGYTQSGNSITVANGTTVSWSVSASGYTTQTGTWTANGSNKTENVVLVASGGSGNALDLSTLSLAHCSSSKIGTGNKENLTYNQATHELKVNSTGWYKVSYFTTPVQVGTEIEYTANYSKTVTGNFVGIYKQEDLVDGITEANGSFWPAPSGFGMYAPGSYTETSPDYVVIWDRSNQKIKTSDLKMGDFLNGKTIKLKMLETGVEVYVDGEKITWGVGSKVTALTPGTNYYLGFHNSGSGTPLAQTINYIGPIR